MRIKSTVAKTAVAGTLTLGLLGATAGLASADPGGHDQQRPEQAQEHRPQQQPEHHNDAPQHGFWFFGTWVPLP
ncbi:hypothetical protein [Nocardia fluminea]|jgi:hypothetical protein|uniref:Uncharacterized protein n=1 Tax=Nocardia fluminea TaxID=134984 RepID=A0A2N3V5C5_9NOCA|nr:hypothetical protein [Nocardia fluminea]PKV76827.1 hypothetical protein ATK86_7234 [Nocardia fluminea]